MELSAGPFVKKFLRNARVFCVFNGGVAGAKPPQRGVSEYQKQGDTEAPYARAYRPECGL
jgi:hypothetical protein